jgi:predicted Rossmann-fold nucleotide-binding protein
MLHRLPIIGVFGSGSPITPARTALARAAGALVARLGAHLLTGAGYGVMAAAAEGFVAVEGRRGFSLGMVPRDPAGALDQPKRADDGTPYPNPFVEIAVFTALPARSDRNWRVSPSRNHVNVLTSDAILALPGAVGTSNELELAAFYRGEALRRPEECRTVLLGPAEEFSPEACARFVHAATLADAERHLARVLAARGFAMVETSP